MIDESRTVPVQTSRRTGHDLSHSAIVAVVGLISATVSIAVHFPVIGHDPILTLINVAVTCTLATLGSYLALSERERFTGAAFMVAGFGYPINDLDIYPGWGAYISYVAGGGALFYGALSWGILRYGRASIEGRAERIFIPVCVVLCSGSGILATLFARPDWLGFPADAAWFTLWPDKFAFLVTSIAVCIGFVTTAVYFSALMLRRLRTTPAVNRGSLQPLAVFGSGLAVGAATIYSIATLAPTLVPLHTLMDLIGILTLGVAAALTTCRVPELGYGA